MATNARHIGALLRFRMKRPVAVGMSDNLCKIKDKCNIVGEESGGGRRGRKQETYPRNQFSSQLTF